MTATQQEQEQEQRARAAERSPKEDRSLGQPAIPAQPGILLPYLLRLARLQMPDFLKDQH